MQVSIIIPVLNEIAVIEAMLSGLQWARHSECEIIVVDGGSTDHSVQNALAFADRVIVSPPGRALQMNAGAHQAGGDILLFLHVDTELSPGALENLREQVGPAGSVWGRFDVRLSGQPLFFRVIERMMNWRSRWTGIATGDQTVFVSRDLFEQVGGFAEIPLMEDINLSRRLKRYRRPLCLRQTVLTSSRRWEENGILRTIFLMWRLRFAYWRGADPVVLARHYGRG
jgi:rSAM/selenodomain-associated transferase 2